MQGRPDNKAVKRHMPYPDILTEISRDRKKLYIKNPIESRIWIFRKTENSKPDLRNGNSAGCSIT